MKKQIVYIVGLLLAFSLFSCNDDIEIWDSNNYDYSGTYIISVSDANGDAIAAGKKIELYNTASDVANELWAWDHNKVFPLKSKISLSGDASNFKSTSSTFADLTVNNLRIEKALGEKGEMGKKGAPTVVGTKETVTLDAVKCSVIEGKIIPNGATTKGGNTADSIYMQLQFYGADLEFISYLLPEDKRANPAIEEFAWKLNNIVYNESKNEVLTVSGHRHTGFSEDEL